MAPIDTYDHVLILGLGASGMAAARLADVKGYSVFVYDDKPARMLPPSYVQQCHARAIPILNHLPGMRWLKSALCVVSPGVPLHAMRFAPILEHTEVVSEVGFAAHFLQEPYIAVTGTNGKSTLCALLVHLLEWSGKQALACGNFGLPLSEVVTRQMDKETICVLELSSFQLEQPLYQKPLAAICLDITEDHLDRYQSFAAYEATKLRMLKEVGRGVPWIVHRLLSERHSDIATYAHAVTIAGGCIQKTNVLTESDPDARLMQVPWDQTPLHGLQGMEAAAFALALLDAIQIPIEDLSDALIQFQPLPFRQEVLPHDVDFKIINDSKSTTPASSIKAMESWPGSKVLILGGRNKDLPLESLCQAVVDQGMDIKVVLYGEVRKQLANLLPDSIKVCSEISLKEAVYRAFHLRETGDILLFSPGFTSFDQFRNYNERGHAFNQFVREHIANFKLELLGEFQEKYPSQGGGSSS